MKVKSLSHVQLFATPWIAAYQPPPTMGFSRQEYWSGVPLPSLGEQTGNKLKLHPLILPSTGHTGDLGNTQLQPRGSRRLTCLDLPRDPVTTRSSHLSLLRDPSAQDSRKSTCLDLPRDLVHERFSHLNLLRDLPVWGEGCPRRSNYLDLSRDLVLKRLSCLNLLGDPAV